MTDSTNPYRLPRTAVPSRYTIHLTPNLDGATFAGTVDIEVDLVEPLEQIILNSAELTIRTASVTYTDGTSSQLDTEIDDETERLICTPIDAAAPAGPATLSFAFDGILNDKLRGFYRSTFTDSDGNERVIATTQFESTDARRAFPCFDEPDFKAVFAVTLTVPGDLLAISNGAETQRENLGDGLARVTFADTIEMSTYLVAFVVGPLEATAPVDVDGVPLRVVHPLGKANLANFALDIGASALRTFTDYYGIGYPGDKVDLVAIPDFAFGAMENLGCITFRETALLADPATATQPELERVADVVAHELAHMWFGDLVTMRWWNGIWLNEAFATFMEMYAVDKFRADWQRWSTFALSRSAAFDTDALASTRPIEFPVHSPSDAEGMFDILTYEKGASVVRMLEQHLGEDAFRDGIRRYLATHAYANTETGGLWDALAGATGEPVREIAESWIFQGGHPLITVAKGAAPNELIITQQLFRYLPSADTATWLVPIGLRVGDDQGNIHTLDVRLDGATTTVTLPCEPAWVIANRGASGFYRTDYAPDLRQALASVALDVAEPTERYTLVDDTWAGVLAGSAQVADIVTLVRALSDETDLSVWRRMLGILGNLRRLARNNPQAEQALAALVDDVVGPLATRLGPTALPGEAEGTTNLRASAFEALGCLAGDPAVVERAIAIVDRDLANNPDPDADPSLTDAAIRIAAEHLDHARFEAFLDASNNAPTPQKKVVYLYALADAEDPEIFARLLGLLLGGVVRTQDIGGLLNRSLTNATNAAAAWEFATANWATLNERLPTNAISRMITGVRTFTDASLAAQVETFLNANRVPQADKAFSQHIERMNVSIALAHRERDGLAGSLSNG